MNVNRFKTDTTLEAEGVWIEAGEGFAVRVARSGNRRHAELMGKLMNDPKHERMRKLNLEIPEADFENILIESISETILLDWKGLRDGDGADAPEIPYSKEKARELLKMRDFRKFINEIANDAANYRARQVGEAVETLKKS